MAVYLLYQDDGPSGICGQSMSITCPWKRLYRLAPDRDSREAMRMIEQFKGRRNPRVTAIFADTEEEQMWHAADPIYDFEPPALEGKP